jgi:hypothetical protein
MQRGRRAVAAQCTARVGSACTATRTLRCWVARWRWRYPPASGSPPEGTSAWRSLRAPWVFWRTASAPRRVETQPTTTTTAAVVVVAPPPPPPEEEPMVGGDTSCCVCMDAPREACLFPCGHVALCFACASMLVAAARHTADCPLCRRRIEHVARVYLA